MSHHTHQSTHSADEAFKHFKCKYRQHTYTEKEALFVYIAKEKVPRTFSDFSAHIVREFVAHMRPTHVPDVPHDLKDQAAADYILAHLHDFVQKVVNGYLEIEKQESAGTYETEVGKHADHHHYR